MQEQRGPSTATTLQETSAEKSSIFYKNGKFDTFVSQACGKIPIYWVEYDQLTEGQVVLANQLYGRSRATAPLPISSAKHILKNSPIQYVYQVEYDQLNEGQVMLANQLYTNCIRQEQGYCSIT